MRALIIHLQALPPTSSTPNIEKTAARETAGTASSVAFSSFICLWQDRKLYFPVEDVSTESVGFIEELLDHKRYLQGSS